MDQEIGAGRSNPLDDSRRRLEAVLNNASVAIFLMDDRQQCIYMNRAAELLTGFSFNEVLDLDRPLHDIIHHSYPDGRPFPLHECAIDRAFPEYHQTRGEEVFVHKNGSFYPVAFTASPIKDSDSNTVGTIIEVVDITEQRRAQERQRLLLNELNHRVKNTLATVQSVAWQTFKGSDPDAVERFNGRLAALSRAHNILTSASWSRASLGEVVDTILDTFGRSRFSVDGPKCEIDPKAAVTLAMVLHELGTNALKHGALSSPEGSVELNWSCDKVDGRTRVELQWVESGGPEVTPPEVTGFGMRLIERQLGLEFGGGSTLEFRPEGLVCTLTLEIPDAPDAILLADHAFGRG